MEAAAHFIADRDRTDAHRVRRSARNSRQTRPSYGVMSATKPAVGRPSRRGGPLSISQHLLIALQVGTCGKSAGCAERIDATASPRARQPWPAVPCRQRIVRGRAHHRAQRRSWAQRAGQPARPQPTRGQRHDQFWNISSYLYRHLVDVDGRIPGLPTCRTGRNRGSRSRGQRHRRADRWDGFRPRSRNRAGTGQPSPPRPSPMDPGDRSRHGNRTSPRRRSRRLRHLPGRPRPEGAPTGLALGPAQAFALPRRARCAGPGQSRCPLCGHRAGPSPPLARSMSRSSSPSSVPTAR